MSHVNRLVYETDSLANFGRSGTGAFDTYIRLAVYVVLATVVEPAGISAPPGDAPAFLWTRWTFLACSKQSSRRTCSPVSKTPLMEGTLACALSSPF